MQKSDHDTDRGENYSGPKEGQTTVEKGELLKFRTASDISQQDLHELKDPSQEEQKGISLSSRGQSEHLEGDLEGEVVPRDEGVEQGEERGENFDDSAQNFGSVTGLKNGYAKSQQTDPDISEYLPVTLSDHHKSSTTDSKEQSLTNLDHNQLDQGLDLVKKPSFFEDPAKQKSI